MKISLIAAMTDKHVIGYQGRLPWHLPEDLAFFKSKTMGHPMLMGNITFKSLPGLLPGRTHLVLSRKAPPSSANTPANAPVYYFSDTSTALHAAAALDTEVFIIGGAQIYAQFLPMATCLYLTTIHAECPGDTFFPDWDRTGFHLCHSLQLQAANGLEYTRQVWEAGSTIS